jgi:hypothetical protein
MWWWLLVLLAGSALAAFEAVFPSTIQTNANLTALTGWTLCYNITYGQSGISLNGPDFASMCGTGKLLVGCRLTGASTALVLAGGYWNETQGAGASPGGTVATNTTTRFYKNPSANFGFTNETNAAPAACVSATGPTDVCWETTGDATLVAAGVCAGTYVLSGSYEKIVYKSACDGLSAGNVCVSSLGACCAASTCSVSGACQCTNSSVTGTLGQCDSSQTCNVTSGYVTTTYKSSFSSCEAGNLCLLGDHCAGNGTCLEGTVPAIQPAPPQCQTSPTCNPSTGNFTFTPAADGTTCIVSACTIGSSCLSGACTGGLPRVCTAMDNCHLAGTCSNATGLCSNPPAPANTSCTTGLTACQVAGQCLANGTCVATVDVDCSTPVGCYGAGTCDLNNGQCINRPFLAAGTPCDDSNGCTPTSVCDGAGTCVANTTTTCTALNTCHRVGTCISYNSSYGACTNPLVLDGFACSPDACTIGATCSGGLCLGGSVLLCPGDQCNDPLGSCNVITGCYNPVPDGTACNDGNACTQDSTCTAGVCGLGTTNTSLPGCPASTIEWWFW